MNGVAVCQAVKKDLELTDVYIVLLTGKGQQEDRQEGLDAGADRYLAKPFDPTEVMLGDQVLREVTVFFSDIREYTALAESMSPEDNFRFVDAYNGRMGPVIYEYNGFVNQYLGDGIMDIFPNITIATSGRPRKP